MSELYKHIVSIPIIFAINTYSDTSTQNGKEQVNLTDIERKSGWNDLLYICKL